MPTSLRPQALIVLVGFVMAMTAPIELLYAIRLGLGPALVTAFIVVGALGSSAIDTLGTRVITRLDARTMLALAMASFGVSEACYALADSPATVIVARLLQGLASAVMAGAMLQLTVRMSALSSGRTSRAVGSVQSMQLLGGAFGAPAGGLVAEQLDGLAGYRLAFGICFLLGLLVSGTALALLPSLPSVDRARPRISLPDLAIPRAARLVLALGLFGNYLRSGIENTGFPLVGNARGLTSTEIGLTLGVLSACEIVVLAGSGRLFERFLAARCLAVALVVGIGAVGVLTVAHGLVWFLVAALGFGLVDGIALAAPPVLLIEMTHDPSLAVATYRIACGLGSMTGSTTVNLLVAAAGPVGGLVVIAALLAGGSALAGRVAVHEIRGSVAQ